jgi:hypothetical protein
MPLNAVNGKRGGEAEKEKETADSLVIAFMTGMNSSPAEK